MADGSIVYVIDDDPSMRNAIEDLLQSVGLGIRVFPSPQEFLKAARPDAPGCIVLDVRLPGQSGLDFQRQIAGTAMELPIVLITGHGDVAMSVRAMKSGPVEFLTKPFRDQNSSARSTRRSRATPACAPRPARGPGCGRRSGRPP